MQSVDGMNLFHRYDPNEKEQEEEEEEEAFERIETRAKRIAKRLAFLGPRTLSYVELRHIRLVNGFQKEIRSIRYHVQDLDGYVSVSIR